MIFFAILLFFDHITNPSFRCLIDSFIIADRNHDHSHYLTLLYKLINSPVAKVTQFMDLSV